MAAQGIALFNRLVYLSTPSSKLARISLLGLTQVESEIHSTELPLLVTCETITEQVRVFANLKSINQPLFGS